MASEPNLEPAEGFHQGELAMQQRAGVRDDARRLVGMLDPVELSGGIVGFLAQRTFLVMAARDADGVLWISPLTGPAGFLEATGPHSLHIKTAPRAGDPLQGLSAGQQVGLVTMEFAKRRRFRINGHLTGAGSNRLSVEVDQAYGNCPQYIQQRSLTPASTDPVDPATDATGGRGPAHGFSEQDMTQIRGADTFFLGTTHPTRGNDASHRGGPPGFVRIVDDQTLWWPDYPGNNMFNSLGNLTIEPTAALLFIDFATGRTLHLTGRAVIEAQDAGGPGDDGHTGRRVRFHLDTVVPGPKLQQRTNQVAASQHNPPVSD